MIPTRYHFSSLDVLAEETGYWGTLSDEQWEAVHPFFPGEEPGDSPAESRIVVEAILWALRHNALWSDLPPGHPHPDQIVRMLHLWCESEEARESLCFMANDWPGARSRPIMRLLEIARGPELPAAISVHTLNHVELSVRHMSTDLYAVLAPVEPESQGDN